MTGRGLAAVALVECLLAAASGRADDVRYYQQGGVTYCETRRMVQERVPESRIEERTETVYRGQLVTEMEDTVRTCWTPVTEYRWEAFWGGLCNPFVEPYLAYRYVPRTHWERRTEVVQVPVTRCTMVPETRVVRRPVAGWRTVRREVVSRVPVSTRAGGPPLAPVEPPALARREPVGGILRLENDPPRYGASTAWRAVEGTIRR